MFIVSRRIGWTQQPQGVSNVALPLGLVHIASYLPNGYSDVSGQAMTRGSAASFSVTAAGRALKQTAVNTSIYRPIVGLPTGQEKYIAVWAGVVVGGPTDTTPKLLGISTTATSQSIDFLGIERGSTSADHLQVISKSNTVNVKREFNVGLTSLYGKQITIVGVFSAVDDVARLHVYADGEVTTYSSAVSSAISPAVLGTERFVVGVDIIENPTRSANVNCNLASIFAGTCTLDYEIAVAKNPWQIFAPRETRFFVPFAEGGATGYTLDAQPSSVSIVGAAATLKATRALSADAGSVTIAGANADLVYTPVGASPVLNADPGSVTIVGVPATLKATRKLAADAGSISIVGANATLVKSTAGLTLNAQPGAVTIAGAAAEYRRTYKLEASSAGITIVGASAQLVYAGATGPTTRAPDGAGPSIIKAGTIRPSNTGGRRY